MILHFVFVAVDMALKLLHGLLQKPPNLIKTCSMHSIKLIQADSSLESTSTKGHYRKISMGRIHHNSMNISHILLSGFYEKLLLGQILSSIKYCVMGL